MMDNKPLFLLEEELTYKLRGIFIGISKEYGSLFKESIYQNLLKQALHKYDLNFKEYPRIPLFDFKTGNPIGNYYPDFLIEGKIIVEIKSQRDLTEIHVNQLIRYLRSSKYEIGFLVNFGTPKAQIFRRIFTNDQKLFFK